ncbi:MAG TPA: glycoside hydrolase family 36 protein [Anaerolineales bacterium]|nr:glycoside hydrolase family 36 protein [Anaerolineales bacterium]
MFTAYAISLSQFQFGDMIVEYLLATESQAVGLRIFPASMTGKLATRRGFLQTHEILSQPKSSLRMRAWEVEPLVQVKLIGDSVDGYSQGITMRNSETLSSLRYAGQELLKSPEKTEVVTSLRSERGYACEHHLFYRRGDAAFTIQTLFRNEGQELLSLELLASFSLSGLTPFAEEDAPNRLYLHRFRSSWSAEGRHICQSVEELNLERSWTGHGVRAERFGQIGSMPTRGYFPFIGVEDRAEGVFWGAQLGWAGSWQMEAYRRDDQLSISGGLADREFGHWTKNVAPNESFSSPLAYVSTVKGDLDDLCQRLTAMQIAAVEQAPASEQSLPVLVNEWCTTWGNPEHERIVGIARRLKSSGAKYFVIDAGWYRDDNGNWEVSQGEWVPSRTSFPQGIAATATAIREQGLIPGIWFEFEVVGNRSPLFSAMTEHLLQRDRLPIAAGQRRFWDFRDPRVHEYLREKVISQLRDSGFGYIKVDYNETIGIGVDGAESLGEGLRQHILAVQEFFREMRQELPDLVIEVCASGGHRLEPSMLSLASMGSFSDAHESLEIPIIAANLHRLILPRQSQIWAVLHATDTLQRLTYSLTAGFLGRLCLSGEIDRLNDEQWSLVQEAIRFYEQVAPIIKNGKSCLYQQIGPAWRHLQGAQAVARISENSNQALVVVHTFAAPLPAEIRIQLPGNGWQVAGCFPTHMAMPDVHGNELHFPSSKEWEGAIIYLNRFP